MLVCFLAVHYFLFSGGRFFYLGNIVIVFNCAHLCIICNLKQRLSLDLKIKVVSKSGTNAHLKSNPYFSALVKYDPC
jgi:hypothetical protein